MKLVIKKKQGTQSMTCLKRRLSRSLLSSLGLAGRARLLGAGPFFVGG